VRLPRGTVPIVLRDRDFNLFWGGKLVSDTGTRAAGVAVPLLLVTVLHAGLAMVGLATALEFLPSVLILLPAGALLDRVRVRGALISCDAAGALLYASVPVAAWLDLLTVGQVLAVVLLGGAAAAVAETGRQAWLPRAFGEEDLSEANALLQAGENAAALGGPALGGLLVQAAGAAVSLLADACSFLASAACLAAVRRREPRLRPWNGPAPGRIRADIAAGARLVAGDPFLRPLTLWAAGLNLGYAGWQVLLVPYLVKVVRVSPGTVGVLVAAGWAGAVLGALASRRAAQRFGSARVFVACAFLAGPPALLIPFAAPGARLAYFFAGTVLFYAGLGASNVITAAFRQAYPPPGMVARVTSAQWTLLNGVYPPGALLTGSLAAWLGIRAGLWAALGVIAASAGFALTPSLRHTHDLPSRETARPHGSATPAPDTR
jgi:predicted MFS family arabinose efflux permease